MTIKEPLGFAEEKLSRFSGPRRGEVQQKTDQRVNRLVERLDRLGESQQRLLDAVQRLLDSQVGIRGG